jgi:hypothetical protein
VIGIALIKAMIFWDFLTLTIVSQSGNYPGGVKAHLRKSVE